MFVKQTLKNIEKLTKYIEKPPTIFHHKNTNTTCFHILLLTFQYYIPLSSHNKSLLENNPILNILGNDSIPSPLLLLPIHFLARPHKAHFIPIKILGLLIS